MTGVLPFIDLNGKEVANAYRTAAYVQRFGPLTFNAARLGCLILGREVGGVGPFVSPAADPAPWYDATVPESAEFLGFVPRLRFQELDVSRKISQRFGSVGGGVIGVEQVAAKTIKCDGYLIALSCAGMEYGRHWFYGQLGADCQGCTLDTMRLRESCPPDDGSNDTRGERIFYDVGLVDGITQSDFGGDTCCDYDGLAFTLASQSPFGYSRAGAATAPAEYFSSGGVVPPAPAILDTGVRANAGPPPSASWTGLPLQNGNNNLVISGNQFANNSASLGAGAYWNAATFGADQVVTAVTPTHANGGSVTLLARLQTPGQLTGYAAFMRVQFGAAGTDFCIIGRQGAVSVSKPYYYVNGLGSQTFAAGDTFMLICRGRTLEGWRKPSGGAWQLIGSVYDAIPTIPAASYVGLMIDSVSATGQTVGAFGAGTLAAPALGLPFPHDVVSIPIPKVPLGITSPIVVLKSPGFSFLPTNTITTNAVRVQMKKGNALGAAGDCFQSDDFSVNDLATRWTQRIAGSWQITGGKLKPLALGLGTSFSRQAQRRDSLGALCQYDGGKVQATIKLGTTLTAGVWGVCFSGQGAYIYGPSSPYGYSNTFRLNNVSNGGAGLDSVAFTPVAGTTYLIIVELLPLALGYDLRGYLVNAATGEMLTRPLRSVIGNVNVLTPGIFWPGIDSIPSDLTEEWDSFYAIDYTDEPGYIEANMPPGTLTIDGSRRTTSFVSAYASSLPVVDGSPYVGSPVGTPLGWPDLCSGDGPGCLQVWGTQGSYVLATVTAAMQNRQR